MFYRYSVVNEEAAPFEADLVKATRHKRENVAHIRQSIVLKSFYRRFTGILKTFYRYLKVLKMFYRYLK